MSGDYPLDRITGVILAGGRATRMGGVDKGLISLNGRPLVAHVLAALRPQVATVLINANRNLESYAELGCRVIADVQQGYPGPLAGIVAALEQAETPWVLTVPCDGPLLAADLGARLYQALQSSEAEAATVRASERLHPVYALLPTWLRESAQDYLAAGERKLITWLQHRRLAIADFSDKNERFINLNTIEERDALALQLAGDHCGTRRKA
ncbi:molybdenum cofactor guanylyltransferase MobA [Nitrococcus mobilis]|uniref:Molybdenum cofactor guanylyltransferase n=1 Tax=Nitrococcus mobilis Nb-231 TaxID=314278 RepID=A4BQX7_9GAMM|nr:molybdenum cofactor guanylyltransferase MobA [Nitrococcus mobilis]EAR21977.1 molybdopterin-guanine dinucleotide biosynthesis protein A [Nitrococcus mobilis Nb-231]